MRLPTRQHGVENRDHEKVYWQIFVIWSSQSWKNGGRVYTFISTSWHQGETYQSIILFRLISCVLIRKGYLIELGQ